MGNAQTILFVCGVITCIIGVCTFITGMMTRAKKYGQLEYKVDSALKGIEEIKQTINKNSSWQESIGLEVKGHEERIDTLFNRIESLGERIIRLEGNYLER